MSDEDPQSGLPGYDSLRWLLLKARTQQRYTLEEYRQLTSVLAFVETDSMYWFKLGGRKKDLPAEPKGD